MPQEPAWLTSAARDGGAQAASRERRPGRPKRSSGDGAWAALTGSLASFKREAYESRGSSPRKQPARGGGATPGRH
jgi:hypothetical protein